MIYKIIILLGGLGALAVGQVALGSALLLLGVIVIALVRPAEKVSDKPIEQSNPVIEMAAVGWGALLLVASLAALAFIINGVMPGGSGLLR